MWKGPAEIEHYNPNYVHYNWHWFWKTGNGDMNNQGTHQLDIARWALRPTRPRPIRAMAIGGRFMWHDQGQTPNTMFGIAEFPNGQHVFFNVRNVNYEGYVHQVENEYYFEDGGKILRKKSCIYHIPAGSKQGYVLTAPHGEGDAGRELGALYRGVPRRQAGMANGNAVDAHYGSLMGHLMNNSYRLGTEVPFNAKAGRFGDDKDAHDHFMELHAIMRDGVGVPEDKCRIHRRPLADVRSPNGTPTGEYAAEANALLKDHTTPASRSRPANKV